MNRIDRRRFLQALAASGMLWMPPFPVWSQVQRKPRFPAYPFPLGVASGYPLPDSVVLWTRLAPLPAAPGGGMAPQIVPVRWEVSEEESMGRLVASGTAYADPAWAHSLHITVPGLQASRQYWYRFVAGDAVSPMGRFRTAPAANARNERLRFAFASCQQYEQGYYGAYRHIVRDDPDLVLFLGDYIYERSWGRKLVRRHGTAETVTLDDYRARYALYKSDPDLQAAQAAASWLMVWDDHEVENDYGADRSENLDHPEWFLARRAAAYKAYYEHMPLPASCTPFGPNMRIYGRLAYGNLAAFYLLDDRQYRTPQACPRPGRGGSNVVDPDACAELNDNARSLLGAAQENWLHASLAGSRTRWNILAQQTLVAQWDQKPGPGRESWTDGWNGYPAARQRLVDLLAERKIGNPVSIGGDIHMSVVADIKKDFNRSDSAVVASEFVGTSITSQARSQAAVMRTMSDNPHIHFAEARYRGYTRAEVTSSGMRIDLRAMDSVTSPDAACRTLASFTVENGRPGPKRL